MIFEVDDKVKIGELIMQPYLEQIEVTGIDTCNEYVGFRSRAPYMSVGGWRTVVGRTGEIRKRVNFDLDYRLDDNWYKVYTNIGLATYSSFNFHESELILIARANPITDWLRKESAI